MKYQLLPQSPGFGGSYVRRIGFVIGICALVSACGGQVGSEIPSKTSLVDTSVLPDVGSGSTSAEPEPIQRPSNIGPLDQFILRISDLQVLPAAAFFDIGGIAASIGAREMAEIETRNSFENEEFIARCMHNLGFDYTPNPQTVTVVESPPGSFIPRGSREWASEFGFGHSTTNALDRANTEFQITRSFDLEVRDAQFARLEQMSESERQAWEDALNRRPESIDDWPTTTEEAKQKLGCSWLFWFLREQQLAQPEFTGIRDLVFEEFPRLLENDPEVRQLNADWSRCMVELGYPGWISPSLISDAFMMIHRQSFDYQPLDTESLLGWDWDTYPDGPAEIERSDLRAQEIAIAVASWDCRDQVGYDDEWRRLSFELQQEFVDRHWLDLEDWARAVEAERR